MNKPSVTINQTENCFRNSLFLFLVNVILPKMTIFV